MLEVDDYDESFNVGEFINIPEDNGILFDKTRDFLIGIQESIYEDGNTEKLEHCLEELCAIFDVHFKPKRLKIENKELNKDVYIHLGSQMAYLEKVKTNRIRAII
tara:strand:+ start:3391 stop:3705 length:315 start_codon:yes stop_codon:yes gene_type:complete